MPAEPELVHEQPWGSPQDARPGFGEFANTPDGIHRSPPTPRQLEARRADEQLAGPPGFVAAGAPGFAGPAPGFAEGAGPPGFAAAGAPGFAGAPSAATADWQSEQMKAQIEHRAAAMIAARQQQEDHRLAAEQVALQQAAAASLQALQPPPDAAELVEKLRTVISVNESTAARCLREANWQVDVAAEQFFAGPVQIADRKEEMGRAPAAPDPTDPWRDEVTAAREKKKERAERLHRQASATPRAPIPKVADSSSSDEEVPVNVVAPVESDEAEVALARHRVEAKPAPGDEAQEKERRRRERKKEQ